MVKDTLNSMLDNIKERTTNPFLGTLLVVWIIRNWTLVYGLFNFDKEFTLDKKLRYIADHYQSQAFVPNLLIVVSITFLVLVSTYCMLTLGRLITDTYDKFVLPYLAKITDKSSIVLKTKYNALEEVVKQLEIRLEEERLAKVGAQAERDRVDKALSALTKSNESERLDDSLYRTVANELRTGSMEKFVDETFENIESNKSMSKNGVVIKRFIEEDYANVKRTDPNNKERAFYELTEEGSNFQDFWLRSGAFNT
jgi:hypothetical protein